MAWLHTRPTLQPVLLTSKTLVVNFSCLYSRGRVSMSLKACHTSTYDLCRVDSTRLPKKRCCHRADDSASHTKPYMVCVACLRKGSLYHRLSKTRLGWPVLLALFLARWLIIDFFGFQVLVLSFTWLTRRIKTLVLPFFDLRHARDFTGNSSRSGTL